MDNYKEIKVLIESQVSKVLTNIAHERPSELSVYDFDDTLAKTEGKVYLLNTKTGKKRTLSGHEFHNCKLTKDEEFDLSDFTKAINPVALPHLSKMKKDYIRLGSYGVTICTARPFAGPVIEFVSKYGMPDIEIVAVGVIDLKAEKNLNISLINARRKKNYLRKKIVNQNLKILNFFDDSIDNVEAAISLRKEFPGVEINVELVKK